jgi:hypothetical protein
MTNTAPTSADRSAPESLREQMLHELEQRSPEGRGPSTRTVRRELAIILPIQITVIAAGLVALYFIGGAPAVAIGVVLVTVYYLIGWSAAIAGAVVRRKEHQRFEAIVDREIEDRRAAADPGPRRARP